MYNVGSDWGKCDTKEMQTIILLYRVWHSRNVRDLIIVFIWVKKVSNPFPGLVNCSKCWIHWKLFSLTSQVSPGEKGFRWMWSTSLAVLLLMQNLLLSVWASLRLVCCLFKPLFNNCNVHRDFSHGKFRLLSLGKASCDRVATQPTVYAGCFMFSWSTEFWHGLMDR